MIEFLGYVLDFINSVLDMYIIPGITIYGLLFYSILMIWTINTMMKK